MLHHLPYRYLAGFMQVQFKKLGRAGRRVHANCDWPLFYPDLYCTLYFLEVLGNLLHVH